MQKTSHKTGKQFQASLSLGQKLYDIFFSSTKLNFDFNTILNFDFVHGLITNKKCRKLIVA